MQDGDDEEGDLRHQEEPDHDHEHEGGVVRVTVLPALADNLQHDITCHVMSGHVMTCHHLEAAPPPGLLRPLPAALLAAGAGPLAPLAPQPPATTTTTFITKL